MLSDKQLAKIEKILGTEAMDDLGALTRELLKNHVVNSSQIIKEAIQELEANPKYTELKESLKALSEGMREIKKRQNAIIQYSLSLLEDKNEQDN